MPSENAANDSIRKAAILVSALDRDSADALLDRMGPDQAARVRNAVFELETISEQEQDAVVREFVLAGGGHLGPPAGDSHQVTPARRHNPKLSPRPEHGEAGGPVLSGQADKLDRGEPAAEAGPFPILREASIETLATHLVHENPQVIAVVVAHLPPQRAAELIAHLAPRQQAEVLRRVAGLDAASPAAIEILQQQLEAKLTEEIRSQRNREVGLAAVNSILNAAGGKRDELLNNLSENDASLRQLVAAAPAAATRQTSERSASQVADVSTGPMATVAPDAPRATQPSPLYHSPTETHAVTPDAAASFDARTAAARTVDAQATDDQATEYQATEYQATDDQAKNDRTSDARTHAARTIDAPTNDARTNAARTISFSSAAGSETESIVFEQLAGLDDEGLALLFGELDPEITLVALAGATPEFVQRVMQPLPPREARRLRRKMERLGPLRLSDIAAAQREIAQTATQMVNAGQLPGLVAPRFAVAA